MIGFRDGVMGVYHMYAAVVYCVAARVVPGSAATLCSLSNNHFDLAEERLKSLENGFFSE